MLALIDPRLWLGVILVCGLAFFAGNYEGRKAEKQKWELSVARDNKKAQEVLEELTAKTRQTELTLREDLHTSAITLQKEKDNAKVTLDALRRDISNGTFRLSTRVASCRPTPFSASSPAVGGVEQEVIAELLPATTTDLIQLAFDADNEVRRTNSCIDAYNKVKDALK